MDDGKQSQPPRILHWAEVVRGLEKLLNQDMFWLTQPKEVQQNIVNYRRALVGIYNNHWADKDIGYPEVLEIVNKWKEKELIPLNSDNDVKTIRTIEIVLMSINLDIAVEHYNQEFVTPDSFEKELLLGTKE